MGKDGASAIVHQEQKNSILSQIHRIVGPFILRRKKMEVDNSILPKKEVMVYCPMTLLQRQQYQTFIRILQGDKKWAAGRQCLGGAMGAGFHFQYMMVSIRYQSCISYSSLILKNLFERFGKVIWKCYLMTGPSVCLQPPLCKREEAWWRWSRYKSSTCNWLLRKDASASSNARAVGQRRSQDLGVQPIHHCPWLDRWKFEN